jgi:hypothetical protein
VTFDNASRAPSCMTMITRPSVMTRMINPIRSHRVHFIRVTINIGLINNVRNTAYFVQLRYLDTD